MTKNREGLEVRRLAAAKDLLAGMSQAHVAKKHGVTRTTTSRWRFSLTLAGVKGLQSRPAPGRPPRLSSLQILELGKICHDAPQEMTYLQVRDIIQKEFGVTYHEDHVGRILRNMGIRGKR